MCGQALGPGDRQVQEALPLLVLSILEPSFPKRSLGPVPRGARPSPQLCAFHPMPGRKRAAVWSPLLRAGGIPTSRVSAEEGAHLSGGSFRPSPRPGFGRSCPNGSWPRLIKVRSACGRGQGQARCRTSSRPSSGSGPRRPQHCPSSWAFWTPASDPRPSSGTRPPSPRPILGVWWSQPASSGQSILLRLHPTEEV